MRHRALREQEARAAAKQKEQAAAKQQKEQAAQDAPAATDQQPPATTKAVVAHPGYLAKVSGLLPAWGWDTLCILGLLGIIGILVLLRKADKFFYDNTIAKKDEAIGKLDQLVAENTKLQKDLNNKEAQLKQTQSKLTKAESEIVILTAEKQAKSEKNSELWDENLKLEQQLEDLKLHAEYIEQQFQSQSDRMTSDYDMFKTDLEAARQDEIDQIRKNGDLLMSKMREEYALKDRGHVKELTEARIELEEMTKLVKEKNPTMHTAIQKELRPRVQARINGDNRKEAKKQEKQLVANEKKMIAPAD